ncbi:hypothetical protein ACWCWD_22700 [Streptomyces sp. NPDC001493]
MAAPVEQPEARAAADAVRGLEEALKFSGGYFVLEQNAPPGGCELRLMPSDAQPWTQGDVQGNLQREGIIAGVRLVETPWLDPGPLVSVELPTPRDIINLGRLVETGLTALQNAGLQLHHALLGAGVQQPVKVRTRVIELDPFTPQDALRIYRRLGGDSMALVDLDLDDWADHKSFTSAFEKLLRAKTERPFLATSEPTCRPCRPVHGRNKLVLDLLDTDDALALAAALRDPRPAPLPSPEA